MLKRERDIVDHYIVGNLQLNRLLHGGENEDNDYRMAAFG